MNEKNEKKPAGGEKPADRSVSAGNGYPGSYLEKREFRRRQVRRRRLLLILAAALAVCAAWVYFFMPSRKRMDPVAYFAEKIVQARHLAGEETGMEEDAEKAAAEEELRAGALAVILEDQADTREALRLDGHLYLNYSMVYDTLNRRFFWDEESKTMLYTTPLELLEIPLGASEFSSDNAEGGICRYDHPVVLMQDDVLYLSADLVLQYTNCEYVSGEDEYHILLHYRWGTVRTAKASRNASVRYEDSIKSPVLADLAEGDEVTVLEENGKWSLVVSPDGFIGYVRGRSLSPSEEKERTREFEEPEHPALTLDEKVRMVWHAIDLMEVNDYLDRDAKSMTGINVISPTWFSLSDNEGHFTSLASKKYVRKAHKKGLQVWGLLSNFNSEISTYQVTLTASRRKTLEEGLIEAALDAGIEGINVDLEMITQDSAPGYVQFIRELSVMCVKNDLILSVDVPVPMSFNEYYDREELGKFCDYVIMMGYDEHYHGSEAGSVASLAFEQNGIEESLKVIPKEKLVSGIPFYTRVWYSQTADDGTLVTDSAVISMYKAGDYIPAGAGISWDEVSQQEYACWTDEEGNFCEIWIENARSIELKAKLVNEYDIAGFAAWVLGDEDDAVWEVLENTVEG